MKYIKLLFILSLILAFFTGCGNEAEPGEMMEEPESMAYEQNANEPPATARESSNMTIISIASANGNLSTLVQAIQQAERTQLLDSEGPFTVFAPTNDAFETLPEGTLEDLMKPENKQKLADILAYHIVEGSVMTADLADGQTITTVQGNTLNVSKENGKIIINGAQVVEADVDASNGTVHVINKVLMPSNN